MATILVVEDELAQLFKQSLTVAGGRYMVETAGDGYAAVRKAKALKPDLILMDLHMPRLNGLEAIRRIRQFNPDVPILAVTAFPKFTEKLAREAGANEYMEKPFDFKELLATVSRLLRGADEAMDRPRKG